MATMTVTHQTRDRFEIAIRDHRLTVDQQRRGAEDAGPNPTELFVASLTACVAHYAARFLHRHEQPYEGVRVDCDWTMLAAEHARVGRIRLTVTPPATLPAELREPMTDAINHCTVHNTLQQPPPVSIALAEAPMAEAATTG